MFTGLAHIMKLSVTHTFAGFSHFACAHQKVNTDAWLMPLSTALCCSPPGSFSKLRFFLVPSFLSKPLPVLSLLSLSCVYGVNKQEFIRSNYKRKANLHPAQPSSAFSTTYELDLHSTPSSIWCWTSDKTENKTRTSGILLHPSGSRCKG